MIREQLTHIPAAPDVFLLGPQLSLLSVLCTPYFFNATLGARTSSRGLTISLHGPMVQWATSSTD